MPLFTRDWLDDPALRQCSPAAQGVLLAVMCLMHESTPYGYLQDGNGVPFSEKFVLSRTMFTPKIYRSAIAELEARGRLHRTPEGVLFCQRMVRDEDVRVRRAAGGNLGGNPTLKVNHSGTAEVNLNGYHNPSRVRSRAENESVPEIVSSEKNLLQNTSSVTRAVVGPNSVKFGFPPIDPEPGENPKMDAFTVFYARWCELTKRRTNESDACAAWLALVRLEVIPAVMACLERYGASGDVSRGAVTLPHKWLYDHVRDGWKSEWPTAAGSNGAKAGIAGEMERYLNEH